MFYIFQLIKKIIFTEKRASNYLRLRHLTRATYWNKLIQLLQFNFSKKRSAIYEGENNW